MDPADQSARSGPRATRPRQARPMRDAEPAPVTGSRAIAPPAAAEEPDVDGRRAPPSGDRRRRAGADWRTAQAVLTATASPAAPRRQAPLARGLSAKLVDAPGCLRPVGPGSRSARHGVLHRQGRHRSPVTSSARGTAVNSRNRSVVWTAGALRLRRRAGRRQVGQLLVRPRLRERQRPRTAEWPARRPARDREAVEAVRELPLRPRGRAVGQAADERPRTSAGDESARAGSDRPAPPQHFDIFGYPAKLPFTGELEYRCASSNKGSDSPGGKGPATMRSSCNMTPGSSGGGWIAAGTLISVTSYSYQSSPVTSTGRTCRGPPSGSTSASAGSGYCASAARLRWVRISLMIRSRRGSELESTWRIAARDRRVHGGDPLVHRLGDRAVGRVALAAGAQLADVHRLARVHVEDVADPVAEAERVGRGLGHARRPRAARTRPGRSRARARTRRRRPPRGPPRARRRRGRG